MKTYRSGDYEEQLALAKRIFNGFAIGVLQSGMMHGDAILRPFFQLDIVECWSSATLSSKHITGSPPVHTPRQPAIATFLLSIRFVDDVGCRLTSYESGQKTKHLPFLVGQKTSNGLPFACLSMMDQISLSSLLAIPQSPCASYPYVSRCSLVGRYSSPNFCQRRGMIYSP